MDFTTIDWQHTLHMSIILLSSLSFLAVSALPFMAIGGQTLSIMRQRTAYAKCAKQVTLLALILGWGITLASLWPLWLRISPSLLPLLPLTPEDGQAIDLKAFLQPIMSDVYLQAHIYVAALLLGASLCLTLFYALWKQWKMHRVAIQCLALIASCWYFMSLLGTLSILSADTAMEQGLKHGINLQRFFVPNFDSSYWNAAPYVLPLAFAMAGGLACLWLMIRRQRDDFGRDYYAQMLPWCASWARNAWLIFWILLLVTTSIQWMSLVQQDNYLSSPEFIRSVAFLLLWLIPGILWTIAMRSEHPLRHKATLFLAFLFGMMSIVPIYMSI